MKTDHDAAVVLTQLFSSDTPDADGRRLQLTPASSIKVRPVLWLWTNRLAIGTLALLGGREGIGKTILAYTLAALITRGLLDGACAGQPRAVIVAATEDSWEHTIVPRLMAAGANLDLVYRVDVVTSDTVDSGLSLPRDLVGLARVVLQVNAALVILDPLLSRLDTKLDTHKDAEVRLALEPLVTLGDDTGACILGLIHVNKSSSADALTTLMGSRAFAAVARSVLFVMADPDDETSRLLGLAKNNLGCMDLPTLGFRIVGHKVADTAEGPVWTGRLDWTGETSRSIGEALQAAAETSGDRTATSEAADWLADYLTSQGGTSESAAIKREGGKAGHSVDALKRARRQLRIGSESKGFPRHTYWSLPVGATSGETLNTALTTPTAPTEAQSVQSAQSERSTQTPRANAPTEALPYGMTSEGWARLKGKAI